MPDPTRVYKDKDDKARQSKMEGKNTPFQKKLREAESTETRYFKYKGKDYAAKPKKNPTAKATGVAKMGKDGGTKVKIVGKPTPKPTKKLGDPIIQTGEKAKVKKTKNKYIPPKKTYYKGVPWDGFGKKPQKSGSKGRVKRKY